MSVAPITPKEAQKQHLTTVMSDATAMPDEVYEAVNEILTERYSDPIIIIYEDEVVSRAMEKMQSDGTSVPYEDFFTYNWLGFEQSYIDAGWIVSYERPASNESFKAHWVFHKNDE